MLNHRIYRQRWLAAAVAGLFTVVGCSHQSAPQAGSQPANADNGATTAKKAEAAKPAAVPSKASEPAQLVTLPKGTAITATVGQTLASDKNHAGDSFAANLSAPVQVDGKTVLPKGARVTGRVVTVKKRELKVTLASVVLHGKSYDLATNSIRPPKKAQAKDNAAAQDKKDKSNITVPAKTQLTFKLDKPVTVPVKG